MVTLLVLLRLLWVSDADAAALARTEPALTAARAAEHLRGARIAEWLTGVPADKLLAIAAHESLYTMAVTEEPRDPVTGRRRWSCGPMTPEPHTWHCAAWELTAIGGYLAGARHWLSRRDACRGSAWCLDIAYGGGMGSVRACAAGARMRVCGYHWWLERRAAIIRRAGVS